MKHTQRIDFLTIAALAMMTLALPVALLDINSSLFPESAVNRFYSSLAFSTDSAATAADADSKPILFIVRKSSEGSSQVVKLTYLDTHNITPETSPRNTCGSALKI